MADAKITALSAATVLVDTDLTALVQDVATTPVTKKVTWLVLKNAITSLANLTSAVLLPWTGLKPGTDGEIPTFDSSGNPAFVAVGTATHVLTSNGAGAAPTFQAAAGGSSSPTIIMSTIFETTTRFNVSDITGGGVITFDTLGALLSTSATATSSAKLVWSVQGVMSVYKGSPVFSTTIYIPSGSTASGGTIYVGMGSVACDGSGHTFTNGHIGFKIVESGGTRSLYATQANGTTETASSALTTVSASGLDLIIKVNSNTSVDYYWRKDASSLSSATNLTTNMPTNNVGAISFSTSNHGTADSFDFQVHSASYSR